MWKNTKNEIEKFKKENKHRICTTMDPVVKYIDPQKIMAINGSYTYPEILNDHKMKKLIESVDEKGWEEKINKVHDFDLLELPNGDLLVNGNGNHRAVLAKERKIPKVRANVQRVVYVDFENESIEGVTKLCENCDFVNEHTESDSDRVMYWTCGKFGGKVDSSYTCEYWKGVDNQIEEDLEELPY